MLKLAKKILNKKKQYKFCEIRKFNNLIDEMNNDPLKNYLFDKGEIKKRVNKINNLFKSTEERANHLHENLIKKNNYQSLFSFYKKREMENIEGLENEKIQILKEKNDFKKLKDTSNTQWDYELNVSENIRELNKKLNFLIDKEKSEFIENDLKNEFDYVKLSHDFFNSLNKKNYVEDLKENEILICNLDFNLRITDLINKLKNYGDFDCMSIKRNLLNNPALIKLNFKNLDDRNKFLNEYEEDLDVQNFRLLTEKNVEEENVFNRRIVIENIDQNISEEEILLIISKYGNILNYQFPKDLNIGKIPMTSEVKKFFIKNKNDIPEETKIELNEFDGEKINNEVLYETKNKMKYFNNFNLNPSKKNEIDVDTMLNLKQIEQNEYLKKIQRDIEKVSLLSIKDNKTYMDYIMESNYLENTEKNPANNLIENNKLNSETSKNKDSSPENNNIIKKNNYYETIYQNNVRNNFGSEFLSKGVMVVELASSYETKKVIFALKFLENMKSVDLLNKRPFMSLIPELKNEVFKFVHNEKYNKLDYDKIIKEKKENERSESYKKKMVNELKDDLKDFEDIEEYLEEDKSNLDHYSYDNKNIKKINTLEKNKKKVVLRERFTEFFENKSYLEFFNRDKNVLTDDLQPLEENESFMNQNGRQFNNENIENTINIIKERSMNKKIEDKNNLNVLLMNDLKQNFNEFTKEEVFNEFKYISQEFGMKEKEISDFENNLEILNQNRIFNPLNDFKKISQRGRKFSSNLKRKFSEETQVMKWDNKLYSEILSDFKYEIKNIYEGKNFENEDFKNWTIETYKRKKKK